MASKKDPAIVQADQLIFEKAVYPRHDGHVNGYHVDRLHLALVSGAQLPPIDVEENTKHIIDGVHRWMAWKKFGGEQAQIPVIWRTYTSRAEAFSAAIQANAATKLAMTPVDWAHCMQRGKELGIPDETMQRFLSLPPDAYLHIYRKHIGVDQIGQPVVVKGSVAHLLSGTRHVLSAAAEDVNRRATSTVMVLAGQLLQHLVANTVPWQDERTVEKLVALRDILAERLAKEPAA